MKIAVICGSQRKSSQTAKVGQYAVNHLTGLGHETFFLDLAVTPLTNFDDSFWSEPTGELQTQWQPISSQLQACDALIVITPDWHGMVPSCLKNFFLYCGVKETANKPGLIIALSASTGGYLPVAELRISSSKTIAFAGSPDHLIIRNVKACFNTPTPSDDKDDTYIQARFSHSLGLLLQYAVGLSGVRESAVADYKTYPFGM